MAVFFHLLHWLLIHSMQILKREFIKIDKTKLFRTTEHVGNNYHIPDLTHLKNDGFILDFIARIHIKLTINVMLYISFSRL